MLRSLTAAEFLEWKAYAEIEPIGDARADYRAALIATTVANAAGPKTAFKLSDFMLKFGDDDNRPSRPRQTWQEQKVIGMMFASGAFEKQK